MNNTPLIIVLLIILAGKCMADIVRVVSDPKSYQETWQQREQRISKCIETSQEQNSLVREYRCVTTARTTE